MHIIGTRAVLQVGGELPRRVQDADVERGDVGVHHAGAAVPGAALQVHPARGALRHHHRGHGRADQGQGVLSPLQGGQVRLLHLHGRLHRRRLLHHGHWPQCISKNPLLCLITSAARPTAGGVPCFSVQC